MTSKVLLVLYLLHLLRQYQVESIIKNDTFLALGGRSDKSFPSPRCCEGVACLGKGRNAVVCSVRNDWYVSYALNLYCSVRHHDPHIPFVVIMAEGDLSATMITKLEEVGVIIRYLPDLRYENKKDKRWENNFIKLRLWMMDEWDSVSQVNYY
jgi:hypothetical protein